MPETTLLLLILFTSLSLYADDHALCVDPVEPARARPAEPPTLRLELVDESSAGQRRLIARVIIVRETYRVRALRLLSSLTSLGDVSPERFRKFCGATYDNETDLGQKVESVWQLPETTGVTSTNLSFERTLPFHAKTAAHELTQFALVIQRALQAFEGQVIGHSLSVLPVQIVDLTVDTPMSAMLKLINTTDPATAPVATRSAEFSVAKIRALQAGKTID